MFKLISNAILFCFVSFFSTLISASVANPNVNFPVSYEFEHHTPSDLSDWIAASLDLTTSTHAISDWAEPAIYVFGIDEHLKASEDIIQALNEHGLDGSYSFLSNFYPCVFSDRYGYTYPTTEHYYQSHKFPMGSLPFLEALEAKTPMAAKLIARNFNEFPEYPLPSNEILIQIMKEALWHKFVDSDGGPTKIGEKLLSTQNWLIIEGNKQEPFTDIRWGAEFNFTEGIEHVTLMGENRLGKLHMEIRSYLRSQTEAKKPKNLAV
jgi:ribA/ribD-fused uncharacterized protein